LIVSNVDQCPELNDLLAGTLVALACKLNWCELATALQALCALDGLQLQANDRLEHIVQTSIQQLRLQQSQ